MAKSDWVMFEWHGLQCEAEVITGDTIGTADVPGGLYKLPPYVDSNAVYAPDGEDIADALTDEAYQSVMDMAIQLAKDFE
jgi:hypothetical protein